MAARLTKQEKFDRIADRARKTETRQLALSIRTLMMMDPNSKILVRDVRDGASFSIRVKDAVSAAMSTVKARLVEIMVAAPDDKRGEIIRVLTTETLLIARLALESGEGDDHDAQVAREVAAEIARRGGEPPVDATRMQA